MKKNITLLGILLISGLAFSQVGINTDLPKATLDVVGKPADISSLDGITAPRLTGDQLRAKTYTSAQTGTLVYVTAADTAPAGQTLDVTAIGYFYFDGTKWVSIGAGQGIDTSIYNSDGSLIGPGNSRTLTLNGKSLNFVGTDRSTYWDTEGRAHQRATNTAADAVMGFHNGNANLWIQQWSSDSSITASGDSNGLSLATHYTNNSAPITLSTSPGSNTTSVERMRITGEGNVGIMTTDPTEKFDNAGITRLRTLPINGATNAINTDSAGDMSTVQDQTFTATKTLVADANGVVGYVAGLPQAPVNIYNANGTLTGDRLVTMNSNILRFSGTDGTMKVDNDGESELLLESKNAKTARVRLTAGTADLQIAANNNGNVDIMATPGGTNSLGFGTNTGANPASKLELYTVGSTRMTIDGKGNVGIGVNNPTEKFHNNGNIRLQGLPSNGTTNAIYTTSTGTASASQDQTFTATRTVVADANGVLGYVTGLPTTGGGTPPIGSINVGQTISAVYSIPNATATAGSGAFRLGAYATANGLTALPSLDGIQMDLLGYDTNYYVPMIINTASTAQLVSFQSFATVVNSNKTLLNQSLSPCPFAANTFTSNLWGGNAASGWLSVDNDNIVYWNTANAEVETTNLQVQVDTNTYRWYEFKWWCMEVSGFKKIFLSVTRKA